jgi:hypothetical protein
MEALYLARHMDSARTLLGKKIELLTKMQISE